MPRIMASLQLVSALNFHYSSKQFCFAGIYFRDDLVLYSLYILARLRFAIMLSVSISIFSTFSDLWLTYGVI